MLAACGTVRDIPPAQFFRTKRAGDDSDRPDAAKRIYTGREGRINWRGLMRLILLSPEFCNAAPGKFKRPLEFLASYLRAVSAEVRAAQESCINSKEWGSAFFAGNANRDPT